ncbi:MAG: hypothetical protein ACP5DZ_02070 [Bacteroidales bacterium]
MGVILDETPDYIQDNAFSGIDVYGLATLTLAGVKINRQSIEHIEQQIREIHDFGTAKLNGNQIRIDFNKDFTGTEPIVTVTPHSPIKDYYIKTQYENGFVLAVENANQFKFNWIAIAEKVTSAEKTDVSIDPHLKSQLEVDEVTKEKYARS